MSSRWISISLRGPLLVLRAKVAFTPACAALTNDDLPMPRAPHKSALLAGSPLAKRSVFSTNTSRTRSIPLRSDISTRLTRATGARRPSGYQTKASAAPRSGRIVRCGESLSSAAAMRSNAASGPAGRAPAFGFGVGRRDDLDFDLAIGVSVNRAALSGAALVPQAAPRENG